MRKEDLEMFVRIPEIKTERLTLRRITTKDLFDVFEYAKDPGVSQYLLWYPHISINDTKRYLNTVDTLYRKGRFYDWGVELNGKMIGTVGFSSFDIDNNSAQLGYVITQGFWGQGIATEAALTIIKFGFEKLGLRRIYARCIRGNEASVAVMKKCKMTFEGLARDGILVKGRYCDIITYSITFNEYREYYY